nr:MAG TPA: hypothetical protein [Caudoviricetes sp.]
MHAQPQPQPHAKQPVPQPRLLGKHNAPRHATPPNQQPQPHAKQDKPLPPPHQPQHANE